MLDQNTDRMWYVIGAVIIGAAIILIMNKTFPQLFASVGDTFKDKTEETTEIVDGIASDTITDIPIQEGSDTKITSLVKDGNGTSFVVTHIPTSDVRSGAYFYINDLNLNPDSKYEVLYDLRKVSGKAMRPHGYADNAIKIDFYMDGVASGNSYYVDGKSLIDDAVTHHVRVVYDMKETITEFTKYSIQPARYETFVKSGSKEPIVVEISNMRIRELKE